MELLSLLNGTSVDELEKALNLDHCRIPVRDLKLYDP